MLNKHLAYSLLAALLCLAPTSFGQDVVDLGQVDPVVQRGRLQGGQPAAGRYYVQFQSGTNAAQRFTAALQAGARVQHDFSGDSASAIIAPNPNAINGLRNHPLVVSVTLDQVLYLHAKPDKTPPTWNAPAVTSGQIDLSWNYGGNAADYDLERCTGGGCQVVDVGSTTSYSDTAVAVGQTYDYRVRAYFSKGGPTNYSSTQSVLVPGDPGPMPPVAPTSMTVTSVSNNFVQLAWTDNSNNEDGFSVARCEGSGCAPATVVGTAPVDGTAYTDNSVAASTMYRYAVQATSMDGNSSFSNIAQISTAADPVDPPTSDPCVMLTGSRQVIPLGVQRAGLPDCVSNGEGIGIAVVDTGIDFSHPDLAPAPDTPGVLGGPGGTSFNALAPGSSCQDNWSHGTHVAGLIAAIDNNEGIVGSAPYATLYCVKVGATDAGEIWETDIFAGLDWILENHSQVTPPIRVVNMSLGGDIGGPLDAQYQQRIQALYNAGIVVVTSAGNDPTLDISDLVPAAFPEVVAVAGTVGEDGILTCPASLLSLFGLPTDLGRVLADTAAASTTDGPGVTISAVAEGRSDFIETSSGCATFLYGTLSTTLGGATTRKLPTPSGYAEARGTSFAAPVIAGIAAQILQGMSSLSGTSADVEAVRAQLQTLGDRPGEAPLDHPWAGSIVTYSPDGVYEGVGQRP